jgi:hypothetical protein
LTPASVACFEGSCHASQNYVPIALLLYRLGRIYHRSYGSRIGGNRNYSAQLCRARPRPLPGGWADLRRVGESLWRQQGRGAYDAGTIFEFVPNPQGGWEQEILYTFKGGEDGAGPNGPLVFDAAGNLYGTTGTGGKNGGCVAGGCGTIFELKHNADGSWTESILKKFDNGKFGGDLEYGLVFDKAGNLYSTSWVGGANRGGSPEGGLIFGPTGSLLGTTENGGNANEGTVFAVTP